MRSSCDSVFWLLTSHEPTLWLIFVKNGSPARWERNAFGPSIPSYGFCHKREGASSLFIFSSSSSGSICILQHYFWLAYTSSARGTLTSTLFLLDSEILNLVSHKRCYENTFRKRLFAVELRPQAVCYCWGPEVLSFLYDNFTGLGWQLFVLSFSWSGHACVVSFWA